MVMLSVVIPCYNEEKNIPLIVNRFNNILNDSKKNVEIILVDNGSSDKTQELIIETTKKYPYFKICIIKENIGYGNGIYQGLKIANGDFLAWTHGDIQTDPKDVLIAYNIIKKHKNYETTYIKGRRYGRSLFDVFFTVGMSFFESMIFLKPFWDINAQPNLFHKSFLNKINDAPLDFSFDLFAYYIAKKNNYKIIRFPVYFGKRLHGQSKWNTGFKSKWKFIKRTIDFSFKLMKKI